MGKASLGPVRKPFSTMVPQPHAAPRSVALDYAVGICGVWISGGFFLDAWAHGHVPVESFFTPYHAVFYSGMLALVLVIAAFALHYRRRGYAWSDTVPRTYRLALLGIPIFILGGIGDMIWHRLLGIEEGVDALLSPTHQVLGLGIFFVASGPIRSVLADRAAGTTLARQLPLVLGLATWLILAHFGTAYAFDPGAGRTNAPPPIVPFTLALLHGARDRLLQDRDRRPDRDLPEHAHGRLRPLARLTSALRAGHADAVLPDRQRTGGGCVHERHSASRRHVRCNRC